MRSNFGTLALALLGLGAGGTLSAWAQNAEDGFAPNPDGSVWAMVVQADGRMVIGGSFTNVASSRSPHVARLNVDGEMDPTFHNPGLDGIVTCLALQADGKVLLGGALLQVGGTNRGHILRLNRDGGLDATFHPGATSNVYCLAVQADGKILVGGYFTNLSGQAATNVGRLNPDGSLDPSFKGGVVQLGSLGYVKALAVQADGRIVVGGYFTNLSGQTRTNLGRLNPDGSVDAGFNPGANNLVQALALQADGKILVGGWFSVLGGTNRSLCGRLNADGSLDPTFDPSRAGGGSGTLSTVAVQPDGKILLGGNFSMGSITGLMLSEVARLNPDGSLDASFNPYPSPNAEVRTVAVQPDGKVLLGGDFSAVWGQGRTNLARFNLDSSLDATFNPGANGGVLGLAVQPNGRIWAAGWFTTLAGQPHNCVGRLNMAGLEDTTFAGEAQGEVLSLSVQGDVRIVLGGLFNSLRTWSSGAWESHLQIGRFTLGTADYSFNPYVYGETGNCWVHTVIEQSDGKLLVGGVFTNLCGYQRTNLGRLNADGTLDTSFTSGTSGGTNSVVYTLAVQDDGKILVGGLFTNLCGQARTNIGRLNPDGSLDSSFNPGADRHVYGLAVQADGKIVAAGIFSQLGGERHVFLGRLNSNGVAETGFNPGGVAAGGMYGLALQADGKILVGGLFTNLCGHATTNIGRLNADGSPDLTFRTAVDGGVDGLSLQADGKVLAGGLFTNLCGQPRLRLGRLSLGSAAVQSLSADPDGSALVWARGGSAPEIRGVTFETSADGTNYTALAPGARVNGGWRLGGLSLPMGTNFYVRARGRTSGGFCSASSGQVEAVERLFLPPRLLGVAQRPDGNFNLSGKGVASQPYAFWAASNLAPPQVWMPLATNSANANGVVSWSDLQATNHPKRFYRLKSP